MIDSETLKEFVKSCGIPFKEGAVSFIFSCPRCHKARKLYLRKTDGRFVCFVCQNDGFYGKPEYAFAELLGLPLAEIRERLYGKAVRSATFLNLEFKSPWLSNEEAFGYEESPMPSGEMTYPPSFTPIVKDSQGHNYLKKRGLDLDIINKYKISYNPSWKTVVFPIYLGDTLIGWQERSTTNDFKYTVKSFPKEKHLMFYNNLNNSNHAILTEGPMDALKAELCGGNVASMGKGVSQTQLDLIKSKVNKLYLGLDPDATKEIDSICRHMIDYMDVYLMTPPKGRKDLGECSFEEVYESFINAQRYCGQVIFNIAKVKNG